MLIDRGVIATDKRILRIVLDLPGQISACFPLEKRPYETGYYFIN